MSRSQQTFGSRLRWLREATGLSLREVARRAEIAPAYLSDIELDRRLPSAETCLLLGAVVIAADPLTLYKALAQARIKQLEARVDKIQRDVEARQRKGRAKR